MKSIYVGIDPGQSGAVGVLWGNGQVTAQPCPVVRTRTRKGRSRKTGKLRYETKTLYDQPGMLELLRDLMQQAAAAGGELRVVLEQVSARPKDGKVQAFKFGFGFGLWQMALTACELPYELITPQVWKPKMVGTGADKNKSWLVCRRLFPKFKPPKTTGCDQAEAVLLAEFYRHREASTPPVQAAPAKKPPAKPQLAVSKEPLRRRDGKEFPAGTKFVVLATDKKTGRVDLQYRDLKILRVSANRVKLSRKGCK